MNFKNLQWEGMFSAWGQEDWHTQSVCYSNLSVPKVGRDAPPIQLHFARWVNLDLANWWLGYLLDNIVPDNVKKHIKIKRIHSKADWPSKWVEKMDRADILDLYDVEPDELPAKKKRTEKPLCGLRPWISVEIDQTVSKNSIFVFGVLVRYVSEFGETLALTRLFCEQLPKIGPQGALTLASHFRRSNGHSLGNTVFCPVSRFKKKVMTFSWKDAWKKLNEIHPEPFYEKRKKDSIDIHFSPFGDTFPQQVDILCNSYNLKSFTLNGVEYEVNHTDPQRCIDLLSE